MLASEWCEMWCFTVLKLSFELTSCPQWLRLAWSKFDFQLSSPLVWRCNVWYHVAVWISDVFIFLECWWILGTENAENQRIICHMISFDVIWCIQCVFWVHLWMGKKWSCLLWSLKVYFCCTVNWSNGPTGLPFMFDVVGQVIFWWFTNFLMVYCYDYLWIMRV